MLITFESRNNLSYSIAAVRMNAFAGSDQIAGKVRIHLISSIQISICWFFLLLPEEIVWDIWEIQRKQFKQVVVFQIRLLHTSRHRLTWKTTTIYNNSVHMFPIWKKWYLLKFLIYIFIYIFIIFLPACCKESFWNVWKNTMLHLPCPLSSLGI